MKKISIYVLSLGFGGAERAISNFANILAEDNNVIINSIYKLESKPFYELNDKIIVNYLTELKPNREEFKNCIRNKKFLKAFIEGLKALKILYLKRRVLINNIKNDNSDIIVTMRKEHNFYLGKYARSGVIKIGQEHNDFTNQKDINKVIKGAKSLDYFMPSSEFLKKKYDRLLMDYDVQVKYIPNVINSYKLKNYKKENQIIAVGRLENIKCFEDTIKVFSRIKYDGLRLVIAGDGTLREHLEQYAKETGVANRIVFKGKLSSEELYKEYEKSLLLISTSLSESFGLVVLEAASCKIPSVVFDSAKGFMEIIDDKITGLVIKNRNIDGMVSSIDNLLENMTELKNMGETAYQKSRDYTYENVKKNVQKFINNI